MPLDTVLFHLDNVIITNRRFTVNQRSFSLRSISAFQVVEHPRSWLPASSCALLACLTGYTAVTTADLRFAAVTVVLLGIAAVLWFLSAPRYSIALDTDDGHFVPLTSRSRFLVRGVASVLQSALAQVTAHAGVLSTPRGGSSSFASPSGAGAPVRESRTGRFQPHGRASVNPLLHIHSVRRRTFHNGKTA